MIFFSALSSILIFSEVFVLEPLKIGCGFFCWYCCADWFYMEHIFQRIGLFVYQCKYLHLTVLVGWLGTQCRRNNIQPSHHWIFARFVVVLFYHWMICVFCTHLLHWNWLSLGEISKWSNNQLTSFFLRVRKFWILSFCFHFSILSDNFGYRACIAVP